MTWYPESFTNVPMNDMRMRADSAHDYPGRTYRFYTGNIVYGFGQGLSYTNYTYKILSAPNKLSLSGLLRAGFSRKVVHEVGDGLNYINIDEVTSCDSLKFSVRISVTNVGNMDGGHVVMLFSRAPKAIKGVPEKQLVGFDRVHTFSYGSTTTSILVDPCIHLSIANEYGKRILPLGDYRLVLGDLEHFVSVETN